MTPQTTPTMFQQYPKTPLTPAEPEEKLRDDSERVTCLDQKASLNHEVDDCSFLDYVGEVAPSTPPTLKVTPEASMTPEEEEEMHRYECAYVNFLNRREAWSEWNQRKLNSHYAFDENAPWNDDGNATPSTPAIPQRDPETPLPSEDPEEKLRDDRECVDPHHYIATLVHGDDESYIFDDRWDAAPSTPSILQRGFSAPLTREDLEELRSYECAYVDFVNRGREAYKRWFEGKYATYYQTDENVLWDDDCNAPTSAPPIHQGDSERPLVLGESEGNFRDDGDIIGFPDQSERVNHGGSGSNQPVTP
jgi:hypothetical protein